LSLVGHARKVNIPKLLQWVGLIFVAAAGPAGAENYVGTLKLPSAAPSSPSGFYTFSAATPPALSTRLAGDNGYRFKLGYKYSRYLAVESEYVDFGSAAGTPFANPASLSSGFRSTGFGIDTIAMLPIWRQFSFYGRLGAYSGSRNIFSSAPVLLVADSPRARVRYGLGVRYDFTKALGIRAELERYSPLASPLTNEPEADLFSVGVSWRF
jgi:OmpA-OmpF porin, OOP family